MHAKRTPAFATEQFAERFFLLVFFMKPTDNWQLHKIYGAKMAISSMCIRHTLDIQLLLVLLLLMMLGRFSVR